MPNRQLLLGAGKAISLGPTLLVLDTFTDIDSTELESHIPETDVVGGGWQNAQQVGAGQAGDWVIVSDIADGEIQSENHMSGIDVGQNGMKITCTIKWRTGTFPGIVWRWDGDDATSPSNVGDWQRLWIHNSTTVNRQTGDDLATTAVGVLGSISDGDEIPFVIICSGNTISIDVNNGELTQEYDDSTHLASPANATYAGIANFDNSGGDAPGTHMSFRVDSEDNAS